jgi:hypothetical protein
MTLTPFTPSCTGRLCHASGVGRIGFEAGVAWAPERQRGGPKPEGTENMTHWAARTRRCPRTNMRHCSPPSGGPTEEEIDVDVATIDNEYQQLQQESQQLTQAIQEFAGKLQTASSAGDAQAKEWVLDLKGIALQIQQEELQVQALLQALHGFAVNNIPEAPPIQPAPAVQVAAPAQGGGILSHFMGGGFGQAMTQGIGMGAGFGIADSVINSLFN